jgi:hypothetical protein
MTNHGKRMWCPLAAILVLAGPARCGILTLNGETTSGSYSPGYVNQSLESDFAQSTDALNLSRNASGPGFSLSFGGVASFGRLSAYSNVSAGTVPGHPNEYFSSALGSGFTDTISIINASSGFLSLDFAIHGKLDNQPQAGTLTSGRLIVNTTNLAGDVTYVTADFFMLWDGTNPPGFSTLDAGVLSGLRSAISISSASGGYVYQGVSSVLIPFTTSSFQLTTALISTASCHAPCQASSNFGDTALIGGYRILDSSMNPIPGASLTSESGYDYTTPPGPAAADAPEPGSAILTAGMLGLLGWRRRRACPWKCISFIPNNFRHPRFCRKSRSQILEKSFLLILNLLTPPNTRNHPDFLAPAC